MQDTQIAPVKEVDHWLELKSQWEGWCSSGGRFYLSDETQRYFERLAGYYFRRYLAGDGKVMGLGYKLGDDREAWSYVFSYMFTTKAKETGAHLLDDIFDRAFRNAAEKGVGGSLAGVMGFLKSQFHMRIRDVVRQWIRDEAGTEKQRNNKEGMDAPLGEAGGDGERSRHDVLADEEGMDAEQREQVRIGHGIGKSRYEQLDADSRVCAYLKSQKVSLANPLVTAHLGKNKSVLYEMEIEVRRGLMVACRELGEDEEGCYAIAVVAFRELQDRCGRWFFAEKANEPLFSLVKEKQPQEGGA